MPGALARPLSLHATVTNTLRGAGHQLSATRFKTESETNWKVIACESLWTMLQSNIYFSHIVQNHVTVPLVNDWNTHILTVTRQISISFINKTWKWNQQKELTFQEMSYLAGLIILSLAVILKMYLMVTCQGRDRCRLVEQKMWNKQRIGRFVSQCKDYLCQIVFCSESTMFLILTFGSY